jgi:predicted small metal-binding protein
MDCDFVARADTEDELLQQAAVHAQAVHSVQDLSPDLVAAVRAAIREA